MLVVGILPLRHQLQVPPQGPGLAYRGALLRSRRLVVAARGTGSGDDLEQLRIGLDLPAQ